MCSYWTPYTLHIGSSLNRLVLQTVPLALLITVDAVCSLTHAGAPHTTTATTATMASSPALDSSD